MTALGPRKAFAVPSYSLYLVLPFPTLHCTCCPFLSFFNPFFGSILRVMDSSRGHCPLVEARSRHLRQVQRQRSRLTISYLCLPLLSSNLRSFHHAYSRDLSIYIAKSYPAFEEVALFGSSTLHRDHSDSTTHIYVTCSHTYPAFANIGRLWELTANSRAMRSRFSLPAFPRENCGRIA